MAIRYAETLFNQMRDFIQAKDSGLYLTNAPTGSGKSQAAKMLMEDFYANSEKYQGIERIFYITPRKNNLPYEIKNAFFVDGTISHLKTIWSSELEETIKQSFDAYQCKKECKCVGLFQVGNTYSAIMRSQAYPIPDREELQNFWREAGKANTRNTLMSAFNLPEQKKRRAMSGKHKRNTALDVLVNCHFIEIEIDGLYYPAYIMNGERNIHGECLRNASHIYYIYPLDRELPSEPYHLDHWPLTPDILFSLMDTRLIYKGRPTRIPFPFKLLREYIAIYANCPLDKQK